MILPSRVSRRGAMGLAVTRGGYPVGFSTVIGSAIAALLAPSSRRPPPVAAGPDRKAVYARRPVCPRGRRAGSPGGRETVGDAGMLREPAGPGPSLSAPRRRRAAARERRRTEG